MKPGYKGVDRLTELEAEIERLSAERQAFADELYELRIRAGCGPEQAGLDVWQQRAELLAALGFYAEANWDDLSEDVWQEVPGGALLPGRKARDAIAKVGGE